MNVNEVIKLIIGNLLSSHLDAKLEAFFCEHQVYIYKNDCEFSQKGRLSLFSSFILKSLIQISDAYVTIGLMRVSNNFNFNFILEKSKSRIFDFRLKVAFKALLYSWSAACFRFSLCFYDLKIP